MSYGVEDLKNPMRFSIRDSEIGVSDFPVEVTKIEMRPSEGNIYLYWQDPDGETDPSSTDTDRSGGQS